MRIVSRAVRSSRATAVLWGCDRVREYHYNRTRIGVAPSVMPLIDSPLSACLALIALWGLLGLAGLLRPTSLRYVGRTLFPLGGLIGIALALVAALSLAAPPE